MDLQFCFDQPWIKMVGTFLSGLILRIASLRMKDYFTNLFKSKEVKEGEIFLSNTELRIEIYNILCEIRGIARCNRASITEYHNGEVSHGGLPFNYASMTYEKTDINTKDINKSMQRIPISSYSKLLVDLHNNLNGFIIVDNKYDINIIEIFNQYGIETSYIFKINGHIKDGSVCISYHNKITLDASTIKLIKGRVSAISQLMNKMKKYK